MGKKRIPFFYIYLKNKLKEICDMDNCLSYEEVMNRIVFLRIPRKLVPKLMKEMQYDYKLMANPRRLSYKIL